MKYLSRYIVALSLTTLALSSPNDFDVPENSCVSSKDELDARVHELLAQLKLISPQDEPMLRVSHIIHSLIELGQLYARAKIEQPTVVMSNGQEEGLLDNLIMALLLAAEMEQGMRQYPEAIEKSLQIEPLRISDDVYTSLERDNKLANGYIATLTWLMPYVSSCLQQRVQPVIALFERITNHHTLFHTTLYEIADSIKNLTLNNQLADKVAMLKTQLAQLLQTYEPYIDEKAFGFPVKKMLYDKLNQLEDLYLSLLNGAPDEEIQQRIASLNLTS